MKPCEHDAGELVGMLHAHVSAAQKISLCGVLGGKSLLGDKHMLHRCVFSNIERGRQCVMDKFIHLQVRPPLLFSPADVYMYPTAGKV